MRKDKTRVLCAISRIDNAERHLLFLLNERKGYNKKAIKWDVETTLYEIRNARTLLKNLEHTKIKKLITSQIFINNKDKNIEVEYTDGSRGYFGFEMFDKEKEK